jgi:hypothetical protein
MPPPAVRVGVLLLWRPRCGVQGQPVGVLLWWLLLHMHRWMQGDSQTTRRLQPACFRLLFLRRHPMPAWRELGAAGDGSSGNNRHKRTCCALRRKAQKGDFPSAYKNHTRAPHQKQNHGRVPEADSAGSCGIPWAISISNAKRAGVLRRLIRLAQQQKAGTPEQGQCAGGARVTTGAVFRNSDLVEV